MNSVSKQIREERLKKVIDPSKVVSTRTYNLVMGGVVLYGLIINIILCGFSEQIAANLNLWVILIGYLVLSIAGIVISRKSDNPWISFLGYNMVCVPLGLVIASVVEIYTGDEAVFNSRPVQLAFLFTVIITAVMVLAAIAFPQFFEKIGKVLLIALIGTAIAGIFTFFFVGMQYIYCLAVAVLFSLYIGYDFYRSQKFPKTIDNAVDCAMDIYLDIANLFLALLRIFGRK